MVAFSSPIRFRVIFPLRITTFAFSGPLYLNKHCVCGHKCPLYVCSANALYLRLRPDAIQPHFIRLRYDINPPYAPQHISLVIGKYRSQREYRQSRKGFISLHTCHVAGVLSLASYFYSASSKISLAPKFCSLDCSFCTASQWKGEPFTSAGSICELVPPPTPTTMGNSSPSWLWI